MGTTALIGAPGHPGPFGPGAAYVFDFDGTNWVETQTLRATDGMNGGVFGAALAISGNVIAIAAGQDDGIQQNTGSVYIFRRDGAPWQFSQNLGSSNPTAQAQFGYSLDLDDGLLVVGSPGTQDIHVYRDTGSFFAPLQRLVPRLLPSGSTFGQAPDVDQGRCLAGDSSATLQGAFSGAAYRLEIRDLALAATPGLVPSGGTLTLTTFGGFPGAPCLMTMRPRLLDPGLANPMTSSPALQGVFNGEGQYTVTLKNLPALAGSVVAFSAFGEFKPGESGASNRVLGSYQ